MTEIDQNGPTVGRGAIKFKNWSGPGICIDGAKCRSDAANFRTVAAFLKSHGNDGQRFAMMLETMAGQFEKAADGKEPKA